MVDPRENPVNPEPENQAPFARLMTTLVPWVASITLALTGTLYLSGFAWSATMIESFGLTWGMFPEPFQVTLARGYLPLLVITPAVVVIGYLVWLIKKEVEARRKRPTLVEALIAPPRPRNFPAKLIRGYFSYVLSLLVLGYGVLAGTAWGMLMVSLTERSIRNGCPDCFVYAVGNERIAGKMIAQNDKATAIYTSDGLEVIETAKLSSVVPATAKLLRELQSEKVAPKQASGLSGPP